MGNEEQITVTLQGSKDAFKELLDLLEDAGPAFYEFYAIVEDVLTSLDN